MGTLRAFTPFLVVCASQGLCVRPSVAQAPAAAGAAEASDPATERRAVAERDAAVLCTAETVETDLKYLRGHHVVGVDAIAVSVHSGTMGQSARLEGVRLHLRAAPAITREWLDQTLDCHRAQGVLGKLSAAELPDDPFWLPDAWVDIQVQSEQAGFVVELRTTDPAQAEALLARARAFGRAHAATAGPTVAAPEAKAEPFSFADWGWMNGTSRQTEFPLDGKVWAGAFNVDVGYNYELSRPRDHTIVGSTASYRHDELQVTHLGVGADLHWRNVRGRFMTQLGLYSTATPRNDASPGRGQWDLSDAYRYIAEVYGGYHFDVLYGLNVDAGIFLSYVGLCSYYNYENWTDQASYVSSNTPWFFSGVRIQLFPSDRFKIEAWIINGWQSYGVYNEMPGLGVQFQYRPFHWLALVGSAYFGEDALGNPDRTRYHSDDSLLVKYFEQPAAFIDRGALSLTVDLGCENGGGVSCLNGTPSSPSQYFAGFMLYNRFWFAHDRFGLTMGGGAMANPGRYLVLLPPVNGATAASGTPTFTQSPGDPYKAWDTTWTFDYMPQQFLTFRTELTHRWASVPYFVGHGGITPDNGNQGSPGSMVPGFTPDLRQDENRFTVALMVRI